MKTNKKVVGCFLAVFMLLAISLASASTYTGSENRSNISKKDDASPVVIKYFEYENDFLKYRAEIIEVTDTTITLRETYYYPSGEELNSYMVSYDINNRKRLNQNSENYYVWIWINEEDLVKDTVYAADKTLTLTETMPDFYVFTYISPEARGTWYYNKNSLILEKTTDVIVLDGKSVSLNTVLTDLGSYMDHDEVSKQTEQTEYNITINDGLVHQTNFLGTTYSPPYYSKGGDDYSKAEWKCRASASWDANHATGRQYNYGAVDSGPHVPGWGLWGRGIAQSWAWVKGPSGGKFSCAQSGTYKVEMSARLNGASQISIVDAFILGSGSASGKNVLTGYLYDWDTGYTAGSLTKTLWEGTASTLVPTLFRTWGNEMTTISFNVNLYSGHQYYFKTQLYAEFRAGHVGLGAGLAETGLEAKLLSVEITCLDGGSTLYEYYNTADDNYAAVAGNVWRAQTFTVGTVGPNEAHYVTSVKLKIYRYGQPGTSRISIRATDGNGKPTGSDLCYKEFDGNSIPTGATWVEFTFDSPALLSASTTYAIVTSVPNGVEKVNELRWMRDTTGSTYAGGMFYYSTNYGGDWIPVDGSDLMFEEYGG